ncbi:MAG: permease [Candidatus Berkelbacteria bacterium]|nr:permease [Candidatus Berkelbacteria bacterium]
MFEKIAQIILGLFSFSRGTRLYSSLEFFIADIIKIFLLLTIIIFVVSIIRSYLPPDRIRKFLAGKNSIFSSVVAALIGIITPFCSCSAIPLFLGFIEAGVPVGATFSFLIASPMVNEVALILLLSMFGLKIALIYAGLGLLIAIISGLILGKIGAEKWIINIETRELAHKTGQMAFKMRLIYAKNYTENIVKNVWIYIVIGVGIGAVVHGYVPVDYLSSIASKNHWYAVPAAVLLGVPLYSNAAGIIPLISVLTEKGVAIGTVLAFMMAVTGLSFPEFMILKKVLRWQLLAIFIAIVTVGIIAAGYLFNAII